MVSVVGMGARKSKVKTRTLQKPKPAAPLSCLAAKSLSPHKFSTSGAVGELIPSHEPRTFMAAFAAVEGITQVHWPRRGASRLHRVEQTGEGCETLAHLP
jgi:hypothetical protein